MPVRLGRRPAPELIAHLILNPASSVDKDRRRAVVRRDAASHFLNRGRIGEVTSNLGEAKTVCGCVKRRTGQITDNHICPVGGKSGSNARTDTADHACDKGDAASHRITFISS